MKLPELIIIGAPKCGTTALWYNLDKHPEISMATRTSSAIEIHFWGFKYWKKGLNWYRGLFDDNKLVGEKSVRYWSNKESLKKIKKYIPNVKLLLCLRNPVDRAYSNYQMHFKSNKVGIFNFNLFEKRYADQGLYIQHIENKILKYFNEDQLHICITEHMKKNPTIEMRKVFDFLDVRDLKYPKKIVEGTLLQDRDRQTDIKANKEEKFYRVWSRHTERLEGPLRDQIKRYYESYNDRLFDYLGREIKEWKR